MQLSCFLCVAETLNFARAAEQLNVTQPAVTQQIHSLEEELNFKLFNRTTRTVEITRAGLVFMSDAKNVLDILERAKKRGENSFEDTRTTFTIGCHTHYETYRFAKVLEQMKALFPEIYPVFKVIPFRFLYQQLAEESIDAIVSFQEMGLKKYISYKELASVPVFVVMPSTHVLAEKDSICTSDLYREKIIITDPWKCPDILSKIQHRIIEDRPSQDLFLCDSIEASITLAKAGYGVAIVPGTVFFPDPALRFLPLVDVGAMSFGIYYKSLAGFSELKAFIRFCREFMF